jgi:hypothetical protein
MTNYKVTQEILNNYFTKEVEDLTPIDYNVFIQDPVAISFNEEDSNYPNLPQGTTILASGNNGQDSHMFLVKTPDNIFYLVDEEDEVVIELAETTEVDTSQELFEIEHYDDLSTNYHFSSFTSYTGLIIHQIVDNVADELGGFTTFTKENLKNTKYQKFTQLS